MEYETDSTPNFKHNNTLQEGKICGVHIKKNTYQNQLTGDL